MESPQKKESLVWFAIKSFVYTILIAGSIALVFYTLADKYSLKNKKNHADAAVQIPQTPVKIASVSYADAVQRAMPGVVSIITTKVESSEGDDNSDLESDPSAPYFFDEDNTLRQEPVTSLGSGVTVSDKGYILTNHHVIESASDIEVILSDGRRAKAKLIGADPETDLAVLKVEIDRIPTITWGDLQHVQVGDVVLAIGNPFNVGLAVTMGIVSALGRNHLDISTFENFIQTDAAINPGNSGGALVNTFGELIGINTAIYSKSGGNLGIGFAIPAATARSVMTSIITTGKVTRGWIGIEPQDLTPEIAESFGLEQKDGIIVTGVAQNSPAEQGGILPGDILVRVDKQKVKDSTNLLNIISQLKPGQNATLQIIRKRKTQAITVAVMQRPAAKHLLNDKNDNSPEKSTDPQLPGTENEE